MKNKVPFKALVQQNVEELLKDRQLVATIEKRIDERAAKSVTRRKMK